jgi:hypothetical protein
MRAPSQAFVRRHWPALAVVALTAVLCMDHLLWLEHSRDGFPFDVDESRYVGFGLGLHDRFAADGVSGFWEAWSELQDFAPLLPLTSVPLFAAFGDGQTAAFAAQLPFFILLVASSYLLGARLGSPAIGALVALAVAASPIVIDFTRSYHFAVTSGALLLASLYALLASERFARPGWSVAWGVLLGLTALSRTMTVALIPAQLVAATWLLSADPMDRRRIGHAAASLGVGLAVALTWYAANWDNVLDYLTNSGYGSASASYGPDRSPLEIGYWTAEWASAVRTDLFLPLGGLVTVSLVLGVALLVQGARLARVGGRGRETLLRWLRSDAAVVAFVVAWSYLALTSSRNQGVGFRTVIVPGAIVLAGFGIHRLAWPRARAAIVAAIVAACVVNLAAKSSLSPGVSSRVIADVPALGESAVIDRGGWIQRYVASAGVAVEPGSPELPDAQRGWLPAYRRIVATVRRLRPVPRFVPVAAVATYEPLFNHFDLVLSGAREFDESFYAVGLSRPARAFDPAEYAAQLRSGLMPNVLITVRPARPSFRQPPLPQKLIERAARGIGFDRVAERRLPDGRNAMIWLLAPNGR